MNEFSVKIVYGKTHKCTNETVDLNRGSRIKFPVASRILQNLMVDKANRAYKLIKDIPIMEWLNIFESMGQNVKQKMSSDDIEVARLLRIASDCSGLAVNRLKKAIVRVAEDMIAIKEIIENQTDNRLVVFDEVLFSEQRTWGYIPSGSNIAVKIPGNYPTININWLLLLAMKRPVLLSASYKDPITPFLFATELYNQGIPDGSISIVYEQFDTFQNRCNQIMISGSLNDIHPDNQFKTKYYHNGKSKTILFEQNPSKDIYRRLAHLSMRGSGRLCTNLSTLLVFSKEEEHAELLATEMIALADVSNIQESDTILPFFTEEEAKSYEELIIEARHHGALDISEKVSGLPFIFKRNKNINYVRPTVLLMDEHNPVFNTELPFPFVIVTRTNLENVPALCKGSLIVSVVGNNEKLIEKLIADPTLDKVFAGSNFDRGYHPTDTHEGFLFDFIFQKKTIVLC
jgi:thienamycin biosynthesis protein ThnO